jgi:phage-related protein
VLGSWDSITGTVLGRWDSITGTVLGRWDSITGTVLGRWDSITGTVLVSWNSITSTVTRLQAGRSGVQIPAGARGYSLLQNIQNSSEVHLGSYTMGTRGSFPGGKAAMI